MEKGRAALPFSISMKRLQHTKCGKQDAAEKKLRAAEFKFRAAEFFQSLPPFSPPEEGRHQIQTSRQPDPMVTAAGTPVKKKVWPYA